MAIIQETEHARYVVFADSLSVISKLATYSGDNQFVQRTRVHIRELIERGKQIKFTWIPSYMGTAGNERVDNIAKKVARGTAEVICIPYQDWFPNIKRKPYERWESSWRGERKRGLYTIKEKTDIWKKIEKGESPR